MNLKKIAAVLTTTAVLVLGTGVTPASAAPSCGDWPYVSKSWFKANC